MEMVIETVAEDSKEQLNEANISILTDDNSIVESDQSVTLNYSDENKVETEEQKRQEAEENKIEDEEKTEHEMEEKTAESKMEEDTAEHKEDVVEAMETGKVQNFITVKYAYSKKII